ncbi:DUF2635 domain-containing protein [Enterobacteriaceae bacterium YMB-R22]|uniref:DUF2635 domain-containing protein n=1 Tax=Tenebrionicola larvae TaxID=2815733 RepID=UPI002012803E|nr:DUF2635 domain-containing protein [Tenebrionicola larvae]MBV4411329.1 DUF2635 domain-containing protein [Tenebrionicola larvae]
MADDLFFIKPAPERSVRDPRTMKLLPKAGASKPQNAYWLRRAAAGDVVVTQSTQKTKKAKAK